MASVARGGSVFLLAELGPGGCFANPSGVGFFSRNHFIAIVTSVNVIVGFGVSLAHGQICEDLFRPIEQAEVVVPSSGTLGLGRSLYELVVPSAGRKRAELALEQSIDSLGREALRAVLLPGSRAEVRRLEIGSRSWDGRDPIFLYLYFEKMSVPARATLARILNSDLLDPRDRLDSAYRLVRRIIGTPIGYESLVSVILENWVVGTRENPRSYLAWSSERYQTFHAMKSERVFESLDFQSRLNQAIEYTLAHRHWKQRTTLRGLGLTVDLDGSLRIGHRFFGKIESENANEVVIRVAREKIKRAAWNPLSEKEVQNKIQNGFQTVRVYESFLGADGYFYLLDGNHRFALDARTEVLVKLSRPMAASSLSDTLDAMGVPQPKIDRIIQYHRGEITLAELIGEKSASQLILLPSGLQ